MKEPLDEKVKKEIDKWRTSGRKYYGWVERNINQLRAIYRGKDTIVSDCRTEISEPIQELYLKDHVLLLMGKNHRKWIDVFYCSFDEKYAITITNFSTGDTPAELRIGFKAYE
ncbi:hypothetical protein HYU07_02285 [Candidatus Woesearchaeota archaeon]|nr:hypothetical protein [Candidatus Woesearchaeota archaeon]